MAMLLRAEPTADSGARAGLLALLGVGAGALLADASQALLSLVGRRGAVMSPRQAAALGCGRATLYRWEKEGRIGRLTRGSLSPGRVFVEVAEVVSAAARLKKG